jgi:putative membrane-bound dehydrogenase-like protein
MFKRWLATSAILGWILSNVALGQSRPEGEDFFFIAPGFSHEGQPRTLSGEGTSTVKITVLDKATSKPTPCRVAVVGPDGHFYQPPKNRLSPYAMTGKWPNKGDWGNRAEKAPYRYLGRYFYTTGETEVAVPPGNVRIEVAKGWEYAPMFKLVAVNVGEAQAVEIVIERTVPMADHGYFNGDIHLHFPRASKADDEIIFDLLDAEDIQYGTTLAYNEPAGPYDGVMSDMDSPQYRGFGEASLRTRGLVSILSGQEYRSVHYGHIMYYLHARIVHEGEKFNIDDGRPFGPTSADVLADGGLAVMAHGGYSKEIYADVALGTLNGVELLQFGIYREIGLADWYHMLNTGYRFPAFGACDFPACRFLGDCRTYVWTTGEASADPLTSSNPPRKGEGDGKPRPKAKLRPSLPDWLRAGASGQSFVSTGPFLLLEAAGFRPGETISHSGDKPFDVPVNVRVRCEVTPVQYLDLIVNGEVVKRVEIPPNDRQGRWHELQHTLTVSESSWIAARAWSTTPGGQPDAEAHTNPVYVYVNNLRPYRQASIDAWVQRIDGQMALHTKRDFKEKARVLDYFQKARDVLLKIRSRNGLAADVEPQSLVGDADDTSDVSRLDITDEELKEYLKPVPPLEPKDAEKSFEVAAGFQMQLVAAEPLVVDPIAAAFDEDGRLYVCEMRDYPYKPAEGKEPIGTLRLLRDSDGDGTFDHATVFADKLLWAAGVVPWKGGVFVAACPDIWFFKDTDGDGVADIKRKVFTGFGTGNQQGMVNNLTFGLDHWVYGATGPNGGMIIRPDDPNFKPVPISGRDFRFHPETLEFEAITGTVQFGNTFDDWGNRFTCSESNPLRHVVFPDHYLARNPFLPAPEGIHNIAPGPVPIFRISLVERWREIRSLRRIRKNERPATSPGASHHVVDAAAGVTIYRGGAYPAEFYGQAFVGDGQNNLVHRRKLIPHGLTFQSERVDQQTEIVRTPDIWFRPVNCVNAPDGTLYILDMSREVLESIHIPLDVAKHLDLRSGRDRGRIYRLAPPNFRSPKPPHLSAAATAELIAELESPHGWRRDTAHRLLFERQDPAAIAPLKKLARESNMPQARLLAFYSLASSKALDPETLLVGLNDAHPGVVENAIKLAEPFLKSSADVLRKVAELADAESPRIRFQAAFSLGEAEGPVAANALSKLARRTDSDVWMRTAVLSSVAGVAADLFEQLLLDQAENDPARKFVQTSNGAAMLGQLAHLIGVRHRRDELERMAAALAKSAIAASPTASDPLVLECGRGLKRVGRRFTLQEYSGTTGAWLAAVLERASQTSSNAQATLDSRLAAVDLLSCFATSQVRSQLLDLLTADAAEGLQIAVMRALSDDAAPGLAEKVLALWPAFTPEAKRIALETMLAREDRTVAFLAAAVDERVSAAEIDSIRRDVLKNHANATIKSLAEKAFRNIASPSRQAVIAQYQPVLAMKGRVEEGAKVFEKNCATCHQVGGKGVNIGPNLASSASQNAATLLTHILDPNQYVLPNYVQYLAVDANGVTHTGLLAAQSATSITLKKEKGETVTLLKSEIEELTSSRKSLMPEGLEKTVSPEAMADLIAFLQEMTKKSPGDPNSERDRGTIAGTLIEE